MHASLLHALDHHAAVRGDKVFTRHLNGGAVEELTFSATARRGSRAAWRRIGAVRATWC
jgi:hypothetical protein